MIQRNERNESMKVVYGDLMDVEVHHQNREKKHRKIAMEKGRNKNICNNSDNNNSI